MATKKTKTKKKITKSVAKAKKTASLTKTVKVVKKAVVKKIAPKKFTARAKPVRLIGPAVKDNAFNPQVFEPKWQKKWEADKLYRSVIDNSKPKHYALTMLPYPSGDLHIGHWFSMTPPDARARFKRMQGYNVLFPMGFDAFGLPAEGAAIKNNIHPKTSTYANIERMRKQMR